MKKEKVWKTLVIPWLAVVLLMGTVQVAFADYNTQWLNYDINDFYIDSRERTGSFVYSGRTYQYELGSSIHFWSFNHHDTDISSMGSINVAGGAKIINPSGYPQLGVIAVTVELTLYPLGKAAWWHWWYSHTLQDGEIAIWEGGLATINLKMQKPGDETLRGIFNLVLSQLLSRIGCPFNPFSIMYLFIQAPEDKDKDAGPSGEDYNAHITGRGGPNSYASLAYYFAYRYLKDGDTGWKAYQLGIKVSADFGYSTQYRDYTVIRYVTTKWFEELWTVYVQW